jgi:hypothetical protein
MKRQIAKTILTLNWWFLASFFGKSFGEICGEVLKTLSF